MTDNPARRVYAEHANALAARWQSAYSPAESLAPIVDLLPKAPSRIADIGAGPGREATWLASLGHHVTAVEPVQAFRDMATNDPDAPQVEWVDESLPDLRLLQGHDAYDLVLLSGVWHHVAPSERKEAMRAFASILSPSGSIILSLRQGQGDPARGLYGADPVEAITLAAEVSLSPLAQRQTGSIQQHNKLAGVHWIWLALARG